MPQVPIETPRVQAQTGFTPLRTPSGMVVNPMPTPPPQAFGAQDAQALTQFGTGFSALGMDGFKIAQNMQLQDDARSAKQSEAQFRDRLRGLTVGNPGDPQAAPGFYGLKGEAALSAYQPTLDAVDKARKDIAGQITNPRVLDWFNSLADKRMEIEKDTMGRFALQQRGAAEDATSTARVQNAVDDATSGWNNSEAVNNSAATIRGEMLSVGQRKGWSPDDLRANTTKALSAMYAGVIRTGAVDNPGAAATIFQQVAPQLDAATRVSLAEHLKPKIIAAKAASDIENDWSSSTMGGPGDDFARNIQAESGGHQFVPGTSTPLVSPKGAVGSAQILPATAQETAQRHGIAWDPERLNTDKGYNEQLGRLYHQDLLTKYDGNATLANAAYNAGPGAVDGWLGSIGDPRKGAITNQQFAQAIPYKETRDYLARTGSATGGQGPLYPDMAGLTQRVLERTAGDPELQAAELSRLGQKKTLYDVSVRGQQETLKLQMADTTKALEAGKDGVEIPASSIRAAFPAPIAEDMIAQLGEAKLAGQINSTLQFASPAQIAASRQDLASGQGPLSAMSRMQHGAVTGPAGDTSTGAAETDSQFALRQKHLATFDRLVAARSAQITADPAAYAQQEPTVKAAFAAAGQDPGAFQAAVQRSLTVQRQLGVGENDLRTLTNQEVQADVKQLHSIDPEKGDMGAALDQMAQKYGPLWPNVMHDLTVNGKLDKSYQALATMTLPGQAAGKVDLQRALKLKAEQGPEFDDGVPHDQKIPLAQAVESDLSDFQATTAAGGQGLFSGVVKPAVTTLATYYAAGGMPASDAATRAYDQIIGQKYDIDGMLRTPKGQMGAVQAAGAATVGRLTEDALATGPGAPTLAEARAGTWTVNSRDDGAILYARKAGMLVAVKNPAGKPIELKFDALPKDPAGVATPPPFAGLMGQ